ncbi:hypothetical protein [Thiohalorhabdus methylotrophus]|uniref:Nucleotide pyrophosphohydrolase n=1 Tax=Thiohalorhabdus methylotrophus TaxID=3242694 RepID=A0ABV4TZ19_9GAMM
MAENDRPTAAEWAKRAEEDLGGLTDDLRFLVEEILEPLIQTQNERQWDDDARVIYEAAGRLARAGNIAAEIGGIWEYLQAEVQRAEEQSPSSNNGFTH